MNGNHSLAVKWLRNLMYIHIAGLAGTVVASVGDLGGVTGWLSRIVQAGMILCLFQMQTVNPRYRKAAILLAVTLVCGLVSTLLSNSTILSLGISICAVIANYQEYNGHSEVTDGLDPQLSRKWNNLFLWSIAVGLLGGFASSVTVVIGVLAGADSAMLVPVAVAVILLVEAVFEVVYLLYLNRMLRLLEKESDISEDTYG